MLDLRRLRYFVAVAESRSFSRAAEQLMVAQSAVSRQVGLLERELGVRLLERSTHDVRITAAGQSLLERGSALLRDADALWTTTREFADGTRGRLTIGYSASSAYETAPLAMAALRSELPEVTVAASVTASVDLPAAVATKALDMALVRCPGVHADLAIHVIRRESLGLVVPAAHPWASRPSVELAELAGERLALHERAANPAHFDLVVEGCRAVGFEPRLMSLTAPFDPAFGLVADGTALTIVGESARQGLPSALAYVPLQSAPRVEIGLLLRSGEEQPHVLRAREVVARAAVELGWIAGHPEAR